MRTETGRRGVCASLLALLGRLKASRSVLEEEEIGWFEDGLRTNAERSVVDGGEVDLGTLNRRQAVLRGRKTTGLLLSALITRCRGGQWFGLGET